MLSLHGWTYRSTRIFVTCHVVKEIQHKNLKNCPYSPQFTSSNMYIVCMYVCTCLYVCMYVCQLIFILMQLIQLLI